MALILIADDEARIRRLVSDFLKRDGHTILEAGDGAEALALIEQHRSELNLAILDVMMPKMDGFAVLRAVRDTDGAHPLPVMMLTARAEDTDELLGLTAGAGMYTVTLAAFFAMLVIISLFPALERFLKDKSNHFEVHLELTNRSNLQEFVTTIRRLGIRIDDIESNPAYLNSGLSVYSVSLTILSKELKKYKRHDEIIQAMRSLDYVYHIEEMN